MRLDGAILINSKPEARTVEVCRSFSRKVNLENYGGPRFENVDFFASRKMQCAADDAEWVSQQIYEECVQEVHESIRVYLADMKAKMQARRPA